MMSMRLAVVTTAAMLAVACGGYSSPSPSPTPTPAPAPTPAPGGAAAAVSIPVGAEALGNRAFTPDALDVAVGTTVTWTNTDSDLPHVDLGRDWLELRNRRAGRQVLFCVPADGNVFVPLRHSPGDGRNS